MPHTRAAPTTNTPSRTWNPFRRFCPLLPAWWAHIKNQRILNDYITGIIRARWEIIRKERDQAAAAANGAADGKDSPPPLERKRDILDKVLDSLEPGEWGSAAVLQVRTSRHSRGSCGLSSTRICCVVCGRELVNCFATTANCCRGAICYTTGFCGAYEFAGIEHPIANVCFLFDTNVDMWNSLVVAPRSACDVTFDTDYFAGSMAYALGRVAEPLLWDMTFSRCWATLPHSGLSLITTLPWQVHSRDVSIMVGGCSSRGMV